MKRRKAAYDACAKFSDKTNKLKPIIYGGLYVGLKIMYFLSNVILLYKKKAYIPFVFLVDAGFFSD